MLSDAQQRARDAEGHLLISAGPGSGKTSTMTARVIRILKSNPDARVATVTFTNDAADELKGRIIRDFAGAATRLVSGTFHALTKSQLLEAKVKVKLASESQKWGILRSACNAEAAELGAMQVEEVASEVDRIRSSEKRTVLEPDNVFHRIVGAYEAGLERLGSMDFTDLIRNAVHGMVAGQIQPLRVTHLLIDEFQDSDDLQTRWALLHAEAGVEVTVCGDDDQSIYGWREARGFSAMQKFLTETGADHVKLEMTYRCAPEIVTAAAALIEYNSERVQKKLRTASKAQGRIHVRRFRDEGDEATAIAQHLMRVGEPHRWAVLGRNNRSLDRVEEALREYGIRVDRTGGTPYWENPGPALLLEGLDLVTRGDVSSLDTFLRNSGVTGAGLTVVHDNLRGGTGTAATRFLNMEAPKGNSADALRLRALQSRLGAWIAPTLSPGMVAQGIVSYMNEFFEKKTLGRRDLAPAVSEVSRMSKNMSLQKMMQMLRMGNDSKKEKPDPKAPPGSPPPAPGVRLLTMHASKGLEWDFVWIIRCEQGMIPNKNSDLYEERRLFYVGMTRARYELVLSRTAGPSTRPRITSQFLEEAGLLRSAVAV